jgi:hypothetical protein
MTEKKQKEMKLLITQARIDSFPSVVRSRLQLVCRYMENITDDSEEVGRHTRITPSKDEIEIAYMALKNGKKPLVAGYTRNEIVIDEDDFFAIYDVISELLHEAKANMELPPL